MPKKTVTLSPVLAARLSAAHIGVDEAGRGCMAGPVCAGAVYSPPGFDFSVFPGLTDSKLLNAAKRDALEGQIKSAPGLIWAVGLAWPKEIDEVNILNATFRAMSRAVLEVLRSMQEVAPLFIDGPHAIPLPQWQAARRAKAPAQPRMYAVIKGDALVPAISAASILAKVQRDRIMSSLARRYPLYGFEKHKGYGTMEHMSAIALHGSSPAHRKSFGAQKGQEQFKLF